MRLPGREALYAALTARELIEWEALHAVDPWGEYRADLRNGILCSLTDSCHRAKGIPGKPIDYMPVVKAWLRPRQSESEMKAIIEYAFQQGAKAKK